jgi:hypothetical protein
MPDRERGRQLPEAFDEVRIFIDADGTVTICDLWEDLLPVARAVGEVVPACPLPARPRDSGPEDD